VTNCTPGKESTTRTSPRPLSSGFGTDISNIHFIAGEEFGLADCAFFPCLAYLVRRGFDLQKEDGGFSRLKAYFERVDALPCAKDARPKGYDKLGKSLFLEVHEIAEELKEGEADELYVSPFCMSLRLQLIINPRYRNFLYLHKSWTFVDTHLY